MDNLQSVRVDCAQMDSDLPDSIRRVLDLASACVRPHGSPMRVPVKLLAGRSLSPEQAGRHTQTRSGGGSTPTGRSLSAGAQAHASEGGAGPGSSAAVGSVAAHAGGRAPVTVSRMASSLIKAVTGKQGRPDLELAPLRPGGPPCSVDKLV